MAKKERTPTGNDAQVRASLRHVRISPQKARLVVDMVRGRQVDQALQLLDYTPKKAARLAAKLIRSAVANATERQLDVDSLWIAGGWVNMGPELRRFMPRAQGRATPIRKRSAHITVVLEARG